MDIDKKSIAYAMFGGDILREQIAEKDAELSVLRKELAEHEGVGVGKRSRVNRFKQQDEVNELINLCYERAKGEKIKDVITRFLKAKFISEGQTEAVADREANRKRNYDAYRKLRNIEILRMKNLIKEMGNN